MEQCHQSVKKYCETNNYKSFFTEDKVSIKFTISRSSVQYMTFTADFDNSGFCHLQTNSFLCDTCTYYAFQKVLNNPIYKWKKRNDGTYYSNNSGGIVLDPGRDTFLLYRMRASK